MSRTLKLDIKTGNISTSGSPDDIGHGGGWWQTPDQTPNSDFGAHFEPYYPSSPEIGYGPDSPTPYTPGSPFYSDTTDPIWGTQEPPWQPPTPDGNSWSDSQWNDHFNNLPQPGWTDSQWNQFIGESTDTISPYSPTPHNSFDDHIAPIFGPIPNPWDGVEFSDTGDIQWSSPNDPGNLMHPGWYDGQYAPILQTPFDDSYIPAPPFTPMPEDWYEMPPPYNPDYVPGYTDPIADDWIANYQTPPDGPVNTGWDDLLNAGYEGES